MFFSNVMLKDWVNVCYKFLVSVKVNNVNQFKVSVLYLGFAGTYSYYLRVRVVQNLEIGHGYAYGGSEIKEIIQFLMLLL